MLVSVLLVWFLIYEQTVNANISSLRSACTVSRFSRVQLFATLGTVAHQAPLSMGFSRQEYWSRLPCPPPDHLPNPGIELASLLCTALAGSFFTTKPPGKTLNLRGQVWNWDAIAGCSLTVFLAKLCDSTITGRDLHQQFVTMTAAAAAAKSHQSCPTLCDPIDGSPPGSPVLGILQARVLEWVAISFSNAWKWKVKVKSLSHVRLLAIPRTAAYQAPPSTGFSRQEYWSGVPSPSPYYDSRSTQIQRILSFILCWIQTWLKAIASLGDGKMSLFKTALSVV